MENHTELYFFQRLMAQMNLPFTITTPSTALLENADLGLRSALGLKGTQQSHWDSRLQGLFHDNVIYYVTDEFSCHYASLILPNTQQRLALVVGPYVTGEIDSLWVQKFLEKNDLNPDWQPILEKHYRRVPYLENQSMLFAALHTLGEQLWGPQQFTTERILRNIPETLIPLVPQLEPSQSKDILSELQLIEKRYEGENRLMQMVSQGRVQQAQMMLSNFPQSSMERRGELTRDVKNYSIILNTLMRKAAEQGGVHPLYIDRVSTEFALQIEITAAWEDFSKLWLEMARKYCLLVRKHTTKAYSALIQKVITRIDFDLAADLSLKATAKSLNVNASYLSTLFKAETGTTLTDYVNKKRMAHAAYLLTTTHLPISAIAQNCGIQDDNYFTKIFKKYFQITPKQFRQENNKFTTGVK